MVTIQKPELVKMLSKLSLIFHKELIEETYAIYWQALKTYTAIDISAACKWFVNNRTSFGFPNPAEFKAAMNTAGGQYGVPQITERLPEIPAKNRRWNKMILRLTLNAIGSGDGSVSLSPDAIRKEAESFGFDPVFIEKQVLSYEKTLAELREM